MGMSVHNEMAQEAYNFVAGLKDEKYARELRSLARSFPSMIQVNGLGCAVAFLYSKKDKPAFEKLYNELREWTGKGLENERDGADKSKGGVQTEFASIISGLSRMEYRMYTNEVMNLCLWIKRFAEGMLSET